MGDLVAARRRRSRWVIADGATTVDCFGADVLHFVAGGCRDRDCSRHGCKLRWNKVGNQSRIQNRLEVTSYATVIIGRGRYGCKLDCRWLAKWRPVAGRL